MPTNLDEGVVCIFDQFDIFPRNQIKAVSQVDNGANHARILVFASLLLPLCLFEGAKRLRLPEIRAGTEPVVVLLALDDIGPVEHGLRRNGSITAVAAENEGCGEASQGRLRRNELLSLARSGFATAGLATTALATTERRPE